MKYYFKYYYLSKISLFLLGKLRAFHKLEDQVIVYSGDHIGEEIYCNGFYEKKEILSIMNSFDFDTSKFNCLDIGANIGNHAIKFSKYFKSVHCFEPNPNVYDILNFNAKNRSNITTYNFGLSNKNEEQYLSYNSQNHGGGKVVESLNDSSTGFSIKLKTLDDFFTENVAYIKIDIEGHESYAIEGMINLLNNDKPILSFEYHNNLGGDVIFEKLREIGYDKFFIPFESNFIKRRFPNRFRLIGFLFGGFFIPRYKLVELQKVKENFYSLIIAENSQSKYRIKTNY